MILHLNSTSTAQVARELDRLRDQSGSVALGRVLTLVIVVRSEEGVGAALDAAGGASRSHPCRIVVLVRDPEPDADGAQASLAAELRVGSEAGLSEVVILRPRHGAGHEPALLLMPLLLPDTHVVVWWPTEAPSDPAHHPVGILGSRRLTNSIANPTPLPVLLELARTYTPGDTDMAWAGCTIWRGYLAAMLDEPPYEPVTSVEVTGSLEHGSTYLLASWLALRLKVPTTISASQGYGIEKVCLSRDSGDLVLHREVGSSTAAFIRPGRNDQRVRLEMRTDENMLTEELQRLDADIGYGQVLQALREGLVSVPESVRPHD